MLKINSKKMKNNNKQKNTVKTIDANNKSKAKKNKKEKIKKEDEIKKLKDKIKELDDKYLRLYSDFENYKRRINKERIELIKNAGEEIISDILPVLDDFERALESFKEEQTIDSIKNGVNLIYQKLLKTLEKRGLQQLNKSTGEEFNEEKHEAITKIKAPTEKDKGKVIQEIERGYKLNEKIIRYPKVVVGE